MSRPVLVLQHGADVPPGVLADVLDAGRIPCVVVRLDRGEPVPELGADTWAGIVSLGGEMGAYDTAEHPYLAAEKQLLRAATGAGVPVLGICLGAQLLAEAAGGAAYRAPRAEARLIVFETGEGTSDPVIDQLDAPQLTFHRDTFDLPPGARLVHASADYPQAYRVGRSIGIQTHPEIDPGIAAIWLNAPEGRLMLADAGVDGSELLDRMTREGRRSREASFRFFEAWLDEVYDERGRAGS